MSDRIFSSTTAATGTDGALAQAVRAALCHLPGVDVAGSVHLVGLASDMAIMGLLALSAYVMLLVGRVSFCQQAFFGVGAYGAGVMTAVLDFSLGLALLAAMVRDVEREPAREVEAGLLQHPLQLAGAGLELLRRLGVVEHHGG